MKSCTQCTASFEIIERDREFYKKIDVPEPRLCPDCRQQRRLSWRNEKMLYQRKCDLCNNDIVSVYAADSGYTVYCHDCWWSDIWDFRAYGRDIDFGRPFFEQCAELKKSAPHLPLNVIKSENSAYTNYSAENKNCYMVFSALRDEDCYYSQRIVYSRECSDCTAMSKGELCYEAIECSDCYQTTYSQNCKDSNNIHFSYDCRGCQDCFSCAGLRNKSYYFFNQSYSSEEYRKKVAEYRAGRSVREIMHEARERWRAFPRRAVRIYESVDCSGDNITKSQNCIDCYDTASSENSRFIYGAERCKECMDLVYPDDSELAYESMSAQNNYMYLFNIACWYGSYIYYSDTCMSSEEIFGCVSTKKAKYAILNKEYSQAEYETLKARLIEHMKQTGEWGEFFPHALSPFAYNETVANEYYPLSKDDVLAHGWRWRDDLPMTMGKETIRQSSTPQTITETTESIVKEIFACATCGRNYKIIKPEFEFYKKMNLAIPHACFFCRNKDRFQQLNPRRLWHRQCMCDNAEHGHVGKCPTEFETTYAPDRPELVYCEECYQMEVV